MKESQIKIGTIIINQFDLNQQKYQIIKINKDSIEIKSLNSVNSNTTKINNLDNFYIFKNL
jgi:hypothetical protein